MAKVLIVEDEILVARMYQQAFKNSGFEVQIAIGGKECIEMVKSFKPEIVLMDIMMPEMTGLSALKSLKADESTKGVPVIMLTNMSGLEDRKKAMELGALDYLVKSQYKPKEVVNKVTEYLKKTQQTPANSGSM